MKNKIFISAYLAIFTLLTAQPVLAVQLTNPLGDVSIPVIIGRVISAALGLSGSAALLMFVYGGFLWLTSGGSKERIDKGKKTLVWAIIGIVVIFAAYVIVDNLILAITSGTTT
ncbi:MAG: pilin [Candidatus Uhrbacteria bacterium]